MRCVFRRVTRRSALLLCAIAAAGQLAVAQPLSYTVSAVPQFPATEIQRVWQPLLERLSQDSGVTLTLLLSKDIPSFEQSVLAGKPDFAYMNPIHQVNAHRAQGYVPLVRSSQLLTGVLVVRHEDVIRAPRELDGQSVAFPAANALGATLMIRRHLDAVEQVPIKPQFAKTHSNAYRQVLLGNARAAGGIRTTLEREPEEIRQKLRVLHETEGLPPHPFSAHPRVPEALRQQISRLLLSFANNAQTKALLDDIPMVKPVAADQQRDYQPIERLRLDRYLEP